MFYFIAIILSVISSSITTLLLINSSDVISFVGSLLGSLISFLGAYFLFRLENKKRDREELDCLLALLKFTVLKVDRVLSFPDNIKGNRSVNIAIYSHSLIYDQSWPRYLRLIDNYEYKESIIKFFDYIQRDRNLTLGDLIKYRQEVIDILKEYGQYSSDLDKEAFYSDLEFKYKKAIS